MPGYPKPPGQRRRRNADAPAWSMLPAEGRTLKVPPLPGGRKMSKTAKDWWKTTWTSPMATMYLAADVPALGRAAMLVDKAAAGDASAAELAELRQLEDRFGLSPASRRRLMWQVEPRTEDAGAGPASSGDREARLRIEAPK